MGLHAGIIFIFLGIIVSLLVAQTDANADVKPPEFYQQPLFTDWSTASPLANTHISLGSTKTLQCKASGSPRPKYRWTKDEKLLNESPLDDGELRLESISEKDIGTYRCIAENTAGIVLSQPLLLQIPFIGQFEPVGQPVRRISRGEGIVLQPPVLKSFPTATLSWLVDGVPVPDRQDNRKYLVTSQNELVVLQADADHTFKVEAYNEAVKKTRSSAPIKIEVFDDGSSSTERSPRFLVAPRNVTLYKQSDTSAVFECVVSARPLADLKLSWKLGREGRKVENDGINFQISPDGRRLTVLKLDPSTEREYTCVVEDASGNEVLSSSAFLEFGALPVIVERPEKESLMDVGQSVVIPCRSIGKPTPKIFWYKNAKTIDSSTSNKFRIAENGSLILSTFNEDDSGIYQCIRQNIIGEESVSTWLRVRRSGARFSRVVDETSLPAIENSPIKIPCRDSSSVVRDVFWTINGQPVENQVDGSGSLLIPVVSRENGGNYVCSFTDQTGERRNYSVTLVVYERTRISLPPKDTQLIIGSKVSLKCGVTKDARVRAEIQWTQDGKPLLNEQARSSRRQVLSEDTTSVLEISGARDSDIGVYTCKVYSIAGNDSHSARLDLLELPYPPLIRAELLNGTKTVNVSWVPNFDGNSPIIRFKLEYSQMSDATSSGEALNLQHGWKTLLNNLSAADRFYVVSDLKPSTTYQFRVSAENSVGVGSPSDASAPILLPQTPPTAVPKLAASARNSSAIMAQWQPVSEDDWNGVRRGYIIRYKLAGYNDLAWTEITIDQEARRNYLITDLIPWKSYEVQIAANNEKGIGPFSESSRVRTLEDAPSAPPTNIQATAVSSTAIEVSWVPPNPQKINGINQGYKVELWPKNSTFSGTPIRQQEVPPSAYGLMDRVSSTFDALEKYYEYYVTVICFTGAGNGPRSSPTLIRTKEDLPGPVKNLHIHNIRDRTIDLKWEEPEKPNGKIVAYTIECAQLDRSSSSPIGKPRQFRLGGEVKKFTVDDLLPLTNYAVKLTASTSVGEGEARTAKIQSGVPPTLPCAPRVIDIFNITARTAALSFDPVCDGNTTILHVNVEIQTAEDTTSGGTWRKHSEEKLISDNYNLVLRDLLPFAEYRIRLSSVNAVGRGNWSEPSAWFQTLADVPSSPPGNFTLRSMNSTAILARWTPLLTHQWNGKQGYYLIRYRDVEDPGEEYRYLPVNDSSAGRVVLSGLKSFAGYESSIVAVNVVGKTSSSGSSVAMTRESVPSGPPLNVVVHAIGSKVLLVRWDNISLSEQNGIILGFKIFYNSDKSSHIFDTGSPSITSTNLVNLEPFTRYSVEVAGYTRMGVGARSTPTFERTFEDIPDRPYNLLCPEINGGQVKVTWEPPLRPNGDILGYRLSYKIDGFIEEVSSTYFGPFVRAYELTNLIPERSYWFMISANTSVGWGNTAELLVKLTSNREKPERPGRPTVGISSIRPRSLTLNWQPVHNDENAPVRFYVIQYLERGQEAWKTVLERIEARITSYIFSGLTPNTEYKFRLQSGNDVGLSEWGEESRYAQTAEDVPEEPPMNFVAVPYTTTSLTLSWSAPAPNSINGRLAGYTIQYRRLPTASHLPETRALIPTGMNNPLTLSAPVEELTIGPTVTNHTLNDLMKETGYEVRVCAYTKAGPGPYTAPLLAYIGEAVPSVVPEGLFLESVTATTVTLAWRVPKFGLDGSGFPTGYKILYTDQTRNEDHVDFVEMSVSRHTLRSLRPFTNYRIGVLVFNSAGDGPKSSSLSLITAESLPEPPSNVSISYIQLNQLTVSWDAPKNPNGALLNYEIKYWPTGQKPAEETRKVVAANESVAVINGLMESTSYTFVIRAATQTGYGNGSFANATTGPQLDGPSQLTNLIVERSDIAVVLRWLNPSYSKTPIEGYVIQGKRNDITVWDTVDVVMKGPMERHDLSYLNLVPSSNYVFRIMALNRIGVSQPSESSAQIQTPTWNSVVGLAPKKPFYLELWFLILVAAVGGIVIILLTACLIIKSKAAKFKQEVEKVASTADILHFPDDDEFAAPTAYELRQSMRRSARRPTTFHSNHYATATTTSVRRKNMLANSSKGAPFTISAPPMIVPSIAYSDGRDSNDLYPPLTNRGYVNDDSPRRPHTASSQNSSSLTDKPSDTLQETSTDEVCDDSSGEHAQRRGMDENTSSFVGHYANLPLNNTLKRTFAESVGTARSNRSHAAGPPPVPLRRNTATSISNSIADSDTTSVCQSLNGGFAINNVPGNRRPLPGFSSFV